MNTFVAVLRDEGVTMELMEELQSIGFIRGVYKLTDNALLVSCSAETPRVLSETLGMSSERPEPTSGVVFKLNGSYFGYYDSDLWDWLTEARNEHSH